MEYASIIWDPHFIKEDSDALESPEEGSSLDHK